MLFALLLVPFIGAGALLIANIAGFIATLGAIVYLPIAMLAVVSGILTFPVRMHRKMTRKSRKKKHTESVTSFTHHDTTKLNHRLQTEHASIGDDGEIVLYDDLSRNDTLSDSAAKL